MARRRNKEPRVDRSAAADLSPQKRPKLSRLGFDAPERPSWRLALIDTEGPWAWSKADYKTQAKLLNFLREMEKLSWTEIRNQQAGGNRRRGQKHKYIPVDSCVPDAQRRLADLELDDYSDSWFRFRTGARERLWGIVEKDIFYPVWWDPDHEVCPSEER